MINLAPDTLCMVHKDKIEILSGNEILKEKVGAKAYGLSALPSAWTLPFLVISSEMYEMYKVTSNTETLEKNWRDKIIEAMNKMHFDFNQNMYLRSNMCTEDLAQRGQFESYEFDIVNMFKTIKIYFDNLKHSDLADIDAPVLVQQYSQAIGKGHVSNERRLSKEHRDWKGEIENVSGVLTTIDDTFLVSLRNWRRKIITNEFVPIPLRCSSLKNIVQVLEIPCTWITDQQIRVHFEWIFDGKHIYIVQADQEQDYGVNPMEQADSSYNSIKSKFIPKALHVLSSEDEERFSLYSKIRNPLIYEKLGFKTAPIYILENHNEIKELLNGNISRQLENDINTIVANPLVIRTDIATKDQAEKQMLPRTDDIRNKKDAIDWLIFNSKKLCDEYKGELPFIFIFHNFIPAFSSAFAYAEPNKRNVLVESLWGVPEGLYYYAHDKHVIDTRQKDTEKIKVSEISVIQKKVNSKNNFIFPDINGKWECNLVATDYIWRPAIPNQAWLKEIALDTRKIADNVGTGVSVMWFVGVNTKVYECSVFPWHHEPFTYDSVPMQTNRKKYKNESRCTIKQTSDIDMLRRIVCSGNRENIKHLLFKPIEEKMIRDKDVIKEVGEIATSLGAVIVLEGGVLSHAYYQLKRTGAAIEVRNAFDSTSLSITHEKLVRDKIPEKIKSSGEMAFTKNLSDDELFEQLRIKLIEEAFEVLEADNMDELIQELADVLEVIDSLMHIRKIKRKSVEVAKMKKKDKVGGFDKGIILRKTALPVYTSVGDVNELLSERNDFVASWADKKTMTDYSKVFKRLRVPVSLKKWETKLTAKGLNKRPDIHVVLEAKRVNANLHIEVSISEDFEQLTLFDE